MNTEKLSGIYYNELYDSIEAIYEKFRGEFIRWMYKKYNCPEEEAIEIYQVATVIVYENIHSGKLQTLNSSLKTYLFAIAKNKYMEGSRYRSKFLYEWDFTNDPAADEDLDELERKEDDLNVVMKSIEEIGEKCKDILQHYYYLNQSMEEIAVSLNYKNADTVKNLKYKCLNRLRKLFKEGSEH